MQLTMRSYGSLMEMEEADRAAGAHAPPRAAVFTLSATGSMFDTVPCVLIDSRSFSGLFFGSGGGVYSNTVSMYRRS